MRLDERRRPVERVVEVLRADERVAAAALTSSYTRGETDGLRSLHASTAARPSGPEGSAPGSAATAGSRGGAGTRRLRLRIRAEI
jgi:hypothetical protein